LSNNRTKKPIRVVFFGTPEFSLPSLEALIKAANVEVAAVITQPDRPAGRGHTVQQSPVKKIAIAHGIPVLQPKNIKKIEASFLNDLTQYGPFDIGVVAAFGQILPQKVLDLPRTGCLNVHGSILPRWRGAAPIHRAILAGDTVTGISLMKMDIGLDTGAVFSVSELPISESDTFHTLHNSLAIAGGELLIQDIFRIVEEEITPIPQDEGAATYAQKITTDEAKIDWSQPAETITRQIRALNPVPGAYTHLHRKRLKVFRATPKAPFKPTPTALPGSVILITNTALEIQCGSNILALEEVQLEGRKRNSIADFLRGVQITKGECLTR